jgi:regulator of replication initiation timing
MLAMFFGYNMKLDQRTLKLEKKNGHEQSVLDFLTKENKAQQAQIDELKKKVAELEAENNDLRQELDNLRKQLNQHQNKHKPIEP